MRALSIFFWLVFAAYTAFWTIKYVKARKCVAFRQSINAEITPEDEIYFTETRMATLIVIAAFAFTTVVDILIAVF